jgi:hypothetical protein
MSLDLDAIEARRADCQTYNFGMRNADKLAHEDVPALLAMVREQQATIERVATVADKWWANFPSKARAIRDALYPAPEAS